MVRNALLGAACVALAAAGCAAGGGAADAPTDDVGALLDDLTANEREIDRELGPAVAATLPGGAGAGERQAAPSRSDEDAAPHAPAPAPQASVAEAEREEATSVQTPCRTACRALASMQRSAERICELVTPGDGRCTEARRRVDASGARVASAGCGCTGEG